MRSWWRPGNRGSLMNFMAINVEWTAQSGKNKSNQVLWCTFTEVNHKVQRRLSFVHWKETVYKQFGSELSSTFSKTILCLLLRIDQALNKRSNETPLSVRRLCLRTGCPISEISKALLGRYWLISHYCQSTMHERTKQLRIFRSNQRPGSALELSSPWSWEASQWILFFGWILHFTLPSSHG